MRIKADEFPLYGVLAAALGVRVSGLAGSMRKAEESGDVDDVYAVALGLYQLSGHAPLRQAIPGVTEDCLSATRAKCIAVFREAAAAGHRGAKAMVVLSRPQGPVPA